MIWFVSVLLIAAPVPAAVTARISQVLASHWRVASSAVTIQWGPVAPSVAITDSARFRLLGSGKDGRYVVVIQTIGLREVAISLRAGHQDSAWVATRPLPTGIIVGPEDATLILQTSWGPPSPDPSPLGREVRRSLAAGERLIAPALGEPVVISPGEPIEFTWEEGPIRITREAIASSRARLGESVWANDLTHGGRIEGIAIGLRRARLIAKGTTP